MVLIHTGTGRAASTWLEAIFLALAEELGLSVHPRGPAAYRAALADGGLRDRCIYPGVFLPWPDLELERCRFPYRILHVRRDPRDVLVSEYYAVKYAHAPVGDVPQLRAELLGLPEEEGMLRLLGPRIDPYFEITLSYLGKGLTEGCLTLEFAELTRDPLRHVRTYLDLCGLSLPEPRLRDLLEARSFRHFTGWRPPGVEDVLHHYRKGTVGDWKEKFTPRVTDAFKARFGEALIRLGYERSLDWSAYAPR